MAIDHLFNVVNNVFVIGMEKCGTTALADWIVTSGLAQDRFPGVKEPYLYANDDVYPVQSYSSTLPLLDSSVGYAGNADVFRRLPEHNTRLVLCLRNQFERSWSAFKMLKVLGVESAEANAYFQSGRGYSERHQYASTGMREVWKGITTRFFPRRSHEMIDRYLDQELEHVRTHTFQERVQYELAFYLTRRQFPFASVIWASFFYHPLRIALEKYQPSDISVVSVSRLADGESRRQFVRSIFSQDIQTAPIPFLYSSQDVEISELKPDFDSKDFDLLRECFRYDLSQARQLISKTALSDTMLDNEQLNRYGLWE